MEKLCHFLGEITCKRILAVVKSPWKKKEKPESAVLMRLRKATPHRPSLNRKYLGYTPEKSKNINFKSHEKMEFVWAFKNVADT